MTYDPDVRDSFFMIVGSAPGEHDNPNCDCILIDLPCDVCGQDGTFDVRTVMAIQDLKSKAAKNNNQILVMCHPCGQLQAATSTMPIQAQSTVDWLRGT